MIASPALGGGQVVVVRAAVAGDRAIRGDVRGRIRCSRPRGLVGMLGYGLGTNTGLKRVATADPGTSDQDLRYVRRRFIHKEQLRNAIAHVVDATFAARLPRIWGEGTTASASDSKKFGAWDQNLMTEWHIRYGGRGVMISWHLERKATCIYSQLK